MLSARVSPTLKPTSCKSETTTTLDGLAKEFEEAVRDLAAASSAAREVANFFHRGHGTKLLRWRPDKHPDQCTADHLVREVSPAELDALIAGA